MAKVFLSHLRADRAKARRLAEFLRHEGHSPWLVEDEALLGESMAETLRRALRDTHAVVVLLSRDSLESAWTSTEVAMARAQASSPLRVYTARLDRVTPPSALAEERSVDLFPGETAWRAGCRQLLHLLVETPPVALDTEPSALPPNNLPPRTAPFVGRQQELATLHERLITSGEAGLAVVRGPQGLGKTAFAVEYASRYAADYPGGIWWIPSWLGPQRALSWLRMSLRYNTGGTSTWQRQDSLPFSTSYDANARQVIQTLQSQREPTLLILDNMRGSTWQDYLVTGRARVLVTCQTTIPTWLQPPFVQSLAPLSRREAEELLRLAAPGRGAAQEPARDRLLDEWLRGNPLLIRLVARLVARTRRSWETLEQELVQRVPRASARPAPHGRAARNAAVLDLCIEQFPPESLPRRLLEGASVSEPSLELYAPLAWAAATGKSATFEEMPRKVVAALRTLERSGLLLHMDPFCQVEEAVSLRARALAAPVTWARVVEQGLTATLEGIQEGENYDAYEPWSTEGDLLHLEAALGAATPQARSDVWVEAARFLAGRFAHRGEHLAAKALRKRALQFAEQELATHVRLVNDLRSDLAATHEALGNPATAMRLLKKAVADDDSSPQVSPKSKAQRLADLALLQFTHGRSPAALESIDRALKLDREALAENHPQFPMRLFLKARILQSLEQGEESHQLLEEALAAGERSSEKSFLPLAPILEALAGSRRERGDEKGALALLERAIAEDQRRLGGSHYETVFHLTELAKTYAFFQRRPQARTAVERILPLLEKALAPIDSRREDILLHLAESLLLVGENAEALPLLEQALAIEAAKPVFDFHRLSRMVLLCLSFARSGNERAVDTFLERVVSLIRRDASESPALARKISELVDRVLHEPEGSRSPATPTSPLQKPSPGAGAESLKRALHLWHRSNLRSEAKADALHEAITAAQQGNDPANGARAQLLLADLEGRHGAWEQARLHAQQGLQLALRSGMPTLVAEGYRLLGDTALHGSFYEEARMSYEEAIRRYDSLAEHRRAAQTRALLATLLLQLGRIEGSEAHIQWLKDHLPHPSLAEEDRSEIREVLALAHRRLSSSAPNARHSRA